MGTPHVHCMSQLPTAHEPADRSKTAEAAVRRGAAVESGPAADVAVGVRAAV
jgi:hypothetical protein